MSEESVNVFYNLINHPIFLSAFFSWFVAQFIKSIIEITKRKPGFSRDSIKGFLFVTGGMPSSHSSVVAALATSVGFIEGIDSPLFITLLCYGILTVRDALGVRRSSGKQAEALNRIGLEIQKRFKIPYSPVKEVRGHKTSEVSVGILLGFFISVAFCKL